MSNFLLWYNYMYTIHIRSFWPSNPNKISTKYFWEFLEITHWWLLIFFFSLLAPSAGCCRVPRTFPNLLDSPRLPLGSVSILFWMSLPRLDTPTALALSPIPQACCLPRLPALIQGEWVPPGRPWEVGGKMSFLYSVWDSLREHQSNVTWLISIQDTRNEFSMVKLVLFKMCAGLDLDQDIWNAFLATFGVWIKD